MERLRESIKETFEEMANALKDFHKEMANIAKNFQEEHFQQEEISTLEEQMPIPEDENQGMKEHMTSCDKADKEDQGIQEKKINDFGNGGKVEVDLDNKWGKQETGEDLDYVDYILTNGRGENQKSGNEDWAQYLEGGRWESGGRENMEFMNQRREKRERNKKRSFKITRKKKIERWLSRGWKIKIREI